MRRFRLWWMYRVADVYRACELIDHTQHTHIHTKAQTPIRKQHQTRTYSQIHILHIAWARATHLPKGRILYINAVAMLLHVRRWCLAAVDLIQFIRRRVTAKRPYIHIYISCEPEVNSILNHSDMHGSRHFQFPPQITVYDYMGNIFANIIWLESLKLYTLYCIRTSHTHTHT